MSKNEGEKECTESKSNSKREQEGHQRRSEKQMESLISW